MFFILLKMLTFIIRPTADRYMQIMFSWPILAMVAKGLLKIHEINQITNSQTICMEYVIVHKCFHKHMCTHSSIHIYYTLDTTRERSGVVAKILNLSHNDNFAKLLLDGIYKNLGLTFYMLMQCMDHLTS